MKSQNLLFPDLARSAVIYLKEEDPRRPHRERIVCAVNVGDFELRYPSDSTAPESKVDDGRTVRRKMWDEAVHALIKITEQLGLNPKAVRNDKNSCRLIVQQDSEEFENRDDNMLPSVKCPDEYFKMELFYCSEFEIEGRKLDYVKKIHEFEETLTEYKRQVHAWSTPKYKKAELEKEITKLESEKKFFLATTPDPREMDSGLIFQIDVLTLKEYGLMGAKLTTVLNEFVAELSRIASENGTRIPGVVKLAKAS
ncbi:MAG: hypothetical protein AB7F43_04900 [Bacteriovoracia bacterium]